MPASPPQCIDHTRDFTIGEPAADSRVVWYIDYSNADVREMHLLITETMTRICEHDTEIAVRPLTVSANEQSTSASRALISASAQGGFWEMHNALLASSSDLTEHTVTMIAAQQGLNLQQFRVDYHSEESEREVRALEKQAETLGLTSGGEVFIDGVRYRGVWDETALLEAIKRPLGYRIQSACLRFSRWAASAGLTLILATIAALLFVNSGFHESYDHLLHTVAGVSIGQHSFSLSMEQWVNDGLMAVFFLLVGIEIKHETVSGDLSDPRRAILPVIAALGGMLVPALIYATINHGRSSIVGWGVPMATDIAFTLGLMGLLGNRVPVSLLVFVSALAIADDLGAILVIAAFYGHGFHVIPFAWAILVLAAMFGLNRSRVYRRLPYLVLGALLWLFIFQSGLHATLAGVLTALTIPSRSTGNVLGVASQTKLLFQEELQSANASGNAHTFTISKHSHHRLEQAVERLREPGFHLLHAVENWSSFLILPLFAFFNMGIIIVGVSFDLWAPESLGVILGLAVGKPLGIVSFCWLSTKLGITRLSEDTTWLQLTGAGCLAGVGFTMSIFIASAAFDDAQLPGVKLSILLASLVASVAGTGILWHAGADRSPAQTQAPRS